MTREEIVTALRCCAEPGRDCEEDCPMNEISREPCRKVLAPAAADLIENQQREIEALRQANEGLRFNLADVQRRGEVTPPYGEGQGYRAFITRATARVAPTTGMTEQRWRCRRRTTVHSAFSKITIFHHVKLL